MQTATETKKLITNERWKSLNKMKANGLCYVREKTGAKEKVKKEYSRKSRKFARLTQLNILIVSHDEDDVGPDVSAVSLDATPEALSPGGGKGPAAWSPVQRQQGQPGQPLNQHGVQYNRPQDWLMEGLVERWEGEEDQPGYSLTPVQLS